MREKTGNEPAVYVGTYRKYNNGSLAARGSISPNTTQNQHSAHFAANSIATKQIRNICSRISKTFHPAFTANPAWILAYGTG